MKSLAWIPSKMEAQYSNHHMYAVCCGSFLHSKIKHHTTDIDFLINMENKI